METEESKDGSLTPDGGEPKIQAPDSDFAIEEAIFAPAAQARVKIRVFEVCFSVALVAYAILAIAARVRAHFGWDVMLAERIQTIKLPGFEYLMIGLSWLGTGVAPFVLVALTGAGLLAAKLRHEALVCVVGTGLGSALDSLLKLISNRPRPAPPLVHVIKHYQHQSFPSGHVFLFVEFFGFLFFLTYVLLKPIPLRRMLLVLLFLPVALIGLSRVYLGAHWPSDVAGGYLGGGLWLMLMMLAYTRLQESSASKLLRGARG